jgi:hypothetical protein
MGCANVCTKKAELFPIVNAESLKTKDDPPPHYRGPQLKKRASHRGHGGHRGWEKIKHPMPVPPARPLLRILISCSSSSSSRAIRRRASLDSLPSLIALESSAQRCDRTQAGSLCYANSPECGAISESGCRVVCEPTATTRRAKVA